MDGSYLLNTNSQNIVQCAAAQRAVTTADVQKMTQTEERQSAVFTELYTARTANSRVQRKAGVAESPSLPPLMPSGLVVDGTSLISV
jgi:hypothetical protein